MAKNEIKEAHDKSKAVLIQKLDDAVSTVGRVIEQTNKATPPFPTG